MLEASRRHFLRGAILYAMAVGSGIGLSACGGGGSSWDNNTAIPNPSVGAFVHGVASGDPLSDRVILWTRVSASAPGTLTVTWEVASDSGFGIIVARGSASTGPQQDYTVKVDAAGLQPASVYYYRFYIGSERSATERTKTLPVGNVSQVKFAIVSCASFPAGYFNVYAEVAKRTDIDVVLHLGDYICEYGVVGFAAQLAIAFDRQSDPSHETLTLDDYRWRHAQYRTDTDLLVLHPNLPVIAVWDDHELANNAWSSGASNHDPATEGSFVARRSAAVQAYHEWLPTRLPDPVVPLKIYRSFDFGNLLSLYMLDTRLIGRNEQLTLNQYLQGAASGASRQLLGVEQSNWFAAQFTASRARGRCSGNRC